MAVQRTCDPTCNVWNHQTDEPDDARDRDKDCGGQGSDEKHRKPQPLDRYAQCRRRDISCQKSIKPTRSVKGVDEDKDEARADQREACPSRKAKPTKHPEDDRVCSAAVTGKNEIVCDGGKEKRHGKACKDQLLWCACPQAVH